MRSARLIITLCLATTISTFANTESVGIQFFKGTWPEALEEAGRTGKIVFVDFYADWCGPCKHMARYVFTDSAVGAYLRDRVISIQVNAEKEEKELVKKMNLQAYPTLALFDATGSVISKQESALETEQLIDFVKSFTSFEDAQQLYMKDPMNLNHAKAYLTLQAYRDNSKLDSISTAILNRLPQENLLSADAWDILVKYSSDFNSPAFAAVTEQADWFYKNEPEPDAFQAGYGWFIRAMISKAADKEDRKLFEKSVRDFVTMRSRLGTMTHPSEYYREAFEIQYLSLRGDSTLRPRMLKFVRKHYSRDWKNLSVNALAILEGASEENVIKEATELVAKALKLQNNALTNYAMAFALQSQGNQQAAIPYFNAALKKSKTDSIVFSSDGTVSIAFDGLQDNILEVPFKVKD